VSTTVETAAAIGPFHVEVPEERLDDLRRRIAATRWPSKELVGDRSQGVQLAALQELARYWLDEYDFLSVDPKDDDRALLWLSTPSSSTNPKRPQLMIVDISAVPAGGPVREVAEGNWNNQFEFGGNPANFDFDLAVHSMGVNLTGYVTHLSYLRGEELELNTEQIAKNEVPFGVVEDLNDDLLTPPSNRVRWGAGDNCSGHTSLGCSESHSSIQVPGPGKPLVYNIDEVYGTYTDPSHGWPWGWARLIDVSDPAHPTIIGEYKQARNTEAGASSDPATQAFTSYSSHNPTVFRPLVLNAWHSAGLQAVDISDPTRPRQAGWFSPTPLPAAATEGAAARRGPENVILWR